MASQKSGAIYLDLTKPFDRFHHDVLLKKLNYYRFTDQLINYLLPDPEGAVLSLKIFDHTFVVKLGIPYGSNIAPCMFSTRRINGTEEFYTV